MFRSIAGSLVALAINLAVANPAITTAISSMHIKA
jgi:hypothetical protein